MRVSRLSGIWLGLWFLAAIGVSISGPGAHLNGFDFNRILAAPDLANPLGFDAFGRSLLRTTLRASVSSALFAATAVCISFLLALLVGSAIALSKGWARFIADRTLAGLLAFPSLLFALAWAAIRGPGWDTLGFALLIGTAPSFIRYVEVRALEILSEDYILAARSLGAPSSRIVLRHLLPTLLPYCAIKLPNLFAHALLAEATLSFLGIGAPIGRDTWGSLLAQGREYLIEAPHIAWSVGLPLVFTVLSLQVLSESRTRLE